MDEDLLPITFLQGIPGGIEKRVDIQDSSGGWKWVQVGGEVDAGVAGKWGQKDDKSSGTHQKHSKKKYSDYILVKA